MKITIDPERLTRGQLLDLIGALLQPYPEPVEQPPLLDPEPVTNHESRLKFGYQERIYFLRWWQLNQRSPGLNGGCTYLEHMLTPQGEFPHPVSRRDAMVAACVVQWLGTNCGGAFLRETEKAIELEQARQEAVMRLESQLRAADWNREQQSRGVFPLRFYRPADPKTRKISLDEAR